MRLNDKCSPVQACHIQNGSQLYLRKQPTKSKSRRSSSERLTSRSLRDSQSRDFMSAASIGLWYFTTTYRARRTAQREREIEGGTEGQRERERERESQQTGAKNRIPRWSQNTALVTIFLTFLNKCVLPRHTLMKTTPADLSPPSSRTCANLRTTQGLPRTLYGGGVRAGGN